MSKELSVEEQNLKRKTRHRLIGAATLTLVMVVVLPMVLDNEPKLIGQNISMDIPQPEKIEPTTPPAAPEPASAPTEVAAPAMPAEAIPVPSVPETPPTIAETPPPAPRPAPKPLVIIPPVNSNNDVSRFILQVGNYSNPAMANLVAEKIRANNLKVTSDKTGNMTRIRVGPFADRVQAEKARQLLLKQGTRSTLLVLQ